MFYFEEKYKNYAYICGVDEAGAGPLAGPVCAAAIIMPAGLQIEGVADSKKLSEKKRLQLREVILEKAIAWSIAFVDNEEIDQINILQARLKAMSMAVEGLSIKADFALVDGNAQPQLSIPSQLIKGGDNLSHTIACASILAKTARDEEMFKYHDIWPQYGFNKHKGYGTKMHFETLREHGLCPIHRKTFLRGM
ncbi:MAG: ribonuclease HII [Defluviitaleaceae bacterium]|nr:ribonuclease HII [Defluviitaleaceae bacterium]